MGVFMEKRQQLKGQLAELRDQYKELNAEADSHITTLAMINTNREVVDLGTKKIKAAAIKLDELKTKIQKIVEQIRAIELDLDG